MQHLKVRRIGNSLGVVLPKDVLARLGVAEGEELAVATDAEGRLYLARREADLERQLEIARKGMARYRNALAELAK